MMFVGCRLRAEALGASRDSKDDGADDVSKKKRFFIDIPPPSPVPGDGSAVKTKLTKTARQPSFYKIQLQH